MTSQSRKMDKDAQRAKDNYAAPMTKRTRVGHPIQVLSSKLKELAVGAGAKNASLNEVMGALLSDKVVDQRDGRTNLQIMEDLRSLKDFGFWPLPEPEEAELRPYWSAALRALDSFPAHEGNLSEILPEWIGRQSGPLSQGNRVHIAGKTVELDNDELILLGDSTTLEGVPQNAVEAGTELSKIGLEPVDNPRTRAEEVEGNPLEGKNTSADPGGLYNPEQEDRVYKMAKNLGIIMEGYSPTEVMLKGISLLEDPSATPRVIAFGSQLIRDATQAHQSRIIRYNVTMGGEVVGQLGALSQERETRERLTILGEKDTTKAGIERLVKLLPGKSDDIHVVHKGKSYPVAISALLGLRAEEKVQKEGNELNAESFSEALVVLVQEELKGSNLSLEEYRMLHKLRGEKARELVTKRRNDREIHIRMSELIGKDRTEDEAKELQELLQKHGSDQQRRFVLAQSAARSGNAAREGQRSAASQILAARTRQRK